jgi:hypothetical protein
MTLSDIKTIVDSCLGALALYQIHQLRRGAIADHEERIVNLETPESQPTAGFTRPLAARRGTP